MKMKFTVLTLLLSAQLVFAQEQEKFNRQELGVAFSNFNFDNVGLSYRIGSEQGLWRFGISARSYKDTNDNGIDSLSSNADFLDRFFLFKVGREQRILVAEGLQVRIGGDLQYSRYKRNSEISDPISSNFQESETTANIYSIGLVLGSIYQINQNIYVGFEFLPKYSLTKSTQYDEYNTANGNTNVREVERTTSNFNMNFNSNTFLFNIGFNF